MASCDACGEHENMPYNCRHCGGTFCADHRLPENHDCPGLENWNDPGGVFDSGFDDSVASDSGSGGGIASRLGLSTRRGGVLGYFRGNMTYVFLGLMWITFAAQFLTRFLLEPSGSLDMRLDAYRSVYRSIFILSPQHPEYVWTWFTSIFAHGGLYHIAGNSIVIYFFGRIVEQYVGSRDFTLLFLVSGVLAGLGQIALTFFQGPITPFSPGVLGASGAGLAIMGTLTVLNPDLKVYLYFLLPVPIWAITGFYAVISVLGVIGPAGAGIANMAHLLGLLIGVTYGQRVKGKVRGVKGQLQFGRGGGGGPGGGRGRGPF